MNRARCDKEKHFNSNLSNFTSCKSEGSHYGWKGAGNKELPLKLDGRKLEAFLLCLKENLLSIGIKLITSFKFKKRKRGWDNLYLS